MNEVKLAQLRTDKERIVLVVTHDKEGEDYVVAEIPKPGEEIEVCINTSVKSKTGIEKLFPYVLESPHNTLKSN